MKQCVLALALFVPAPTAAQSLAARADALLEPLARSGQFSGAVAISRGGKIVYSRGFGFADVERKVPFLPDTPADGGSLAKPVTAAAILLLAKQGRLDLDAPASRYVPEFPHRTTVRHMLSHSGGLPDYDAFQAMIEAGPTTNLDLARALKRVRPAPSFRPGSAFVYCNLCYDMLALIVERVSGEPYGSFVRTRFFAPAGIRSSFVRPAKLAEMEGRRAKGYRRAGDRWELHEPFDNEGFHGASNIYFTAADLARWAGAWAMGSAELRDIAAEARQPARIGRARSGLTLGSWYCDGPKPRCYYTGHHQGFHNFGFWDAGRRIAVAFVSNNTLAPHLQPGLARALVELAEGRTPRPLPAPSAPRLDAAALAGSYRLSMGTVTVAAGAEGATVTPPSGIAYPIYPMRGWFYAPGLDAFLTRSGEKLRWVSVFAEESGERLR